MTATMLFVLLSAFFLAVVNGANDVSKGIATLVGSAVTDLRRGIMIGAIFTGFGALAGAGFLTDTARTFGSDLLVEGTVPTPAAAIAVVLGAGLCVLIATILAIPISTTHAIVGAMGGVGIVAFGMQNVRLGAVILKVAIPLALSPLLAFGMTVALTRFMLAQKEKGTGSGRADTIVGSMSTQMVDKFAQSHWFVACGTCFGRGMLDAPKLLALPLAAGTLSGNNDIQYALFLIIAGGMVVGSVLGGAKVTKTMSERITRIGSGSGFVAALVTALLVNAAAVTELPIATTQVSFTAIVGTSMGAHGGQRLNMATVRRALIAWLLTLPVAALMGIAVYSVVAHLVPAP
ncbi:MAG: inorganic phosphate transporter [Polyangiaceae bacterium]